MFFKRWCPLLLALLILFCSMQISMAGGLFPKANEVFGDYVASVPAILDRDADSDSTSGTIRTLTFNGFTLSEYENLSLGLGAEGCTLKGSTSGSDSASFTVNSEGHQISFTYQYPKAILTVVYSADVRLKETASTAAATGILPDAAHLVGESAPSIAVSIGKTTIKANSNGITIESCDSAYEADYKKYGGALGQDGWKLASTDATDGTVVATLSKGNALIKVTYSPATSFLKTSYSFLSYGETKTIKSGASILPALDAVLGTSLPTVADAIQRTPDSERINAAGETIQTYNNFTDADYNVFSTYLSTAGCSVDGYSLDGTVMTINLSKNGSKFDFVYDRASSVVTVIYATGTRPMQAVIATATPVPTATPKPTATPTQKPTAKPKNYTVNQCYNSAVTYIKNRLKNPNSLIVNNYTYYEVTGGTYSGCYCFTFDYSAQNGFGGYNRSTFYVYVDYSTGNAKYGWSSD